MSYPGDTTHYTDQGIYYVPQMALCFSLSWYHPCIIHYPVEESYINRSNKILHIKFGGDGEQLSPAGPITVQWGSGQDYMLAVNDHCDQCQSKQDPLKLWDIVVTAQKIEQYTSK